MYLLEGVKKVSALPPYKAVLFPWDSAEDVKLRGGARVHRCKLLIRDTMVPFSSYCGLGPITKLDVGRTLVVDFYEDGRIIDAFV